MHKDGKLSWFDTHRKDHSGREWLFPLALLLSAGLWIVIFAGVGLTL